MRELRNGHQKRCDSVAQGDGASRAQEIVGAVHCSGYAARRFLFPPLAHASTRARDDFMRVRARPRRLPAPTGPPTAFP